jgi:hypothetical protein
MLEADEKRAVAAEEARVRLLQEEEEKVAGLKRKLEKVQQAVANDGDMTLLETEKQLLQAELRRVTLQPAATDDNQPQAHRGTQTAFIITHIHSVNSPALDIKTYFFL